MTEFTPLQSLFGGALIGVSAVLLMALLGRIAGVTGILSGLLIPQTRADWAWRLAFVLGMVGGPAVYAHVLAQTIPLQTSASPILLALSGAIVGTGVTYASGCTSGHGVCGMARFSARSISATVVFMATTAATVYVARHVLGG